MKKFLLLLLMALSFGIAEAARPKSMAHNMLERVTTLLVVTGGLYATYRGVCWYLTNNFSVGALRADMTAQLTAVQDQIATFKTELTGLQANLLALVERSAAIEGKIDTVSTNVVAIDGKVVALADRVDTFAAASQREHARFNDQLVQLGLIRDVQHGELLRQNDEAKSEVREVGRRLDAIEGHLKTLVNALQVNSTNTSSESQAGAPVGGNRLRLLQLFGLQQ